MGDCMGDRASGVRWLCLARYAAALVVAVLAGVVVIMGRLNLVIRPATLQLDISQSHVFVMRYKTPDDNTRYLFRFYLEAINPSELVFVQYSNITVQLVDDSSSFLAKFDNVSPSSISLEKMGKQLFLVYGFLDARNVTETAVQKLFKVGTVVYGARMVLTGVVGVDNSKGSIKTYSARFSCEPVDLINGPLQQPSYLNYQAGCLTIRSIQ